MKYYLYKNFPVLWLWIHSPFRELLALIKKIFRPKGICKDKYCTLWATLPESNYSLCAFHYQESLFTKELFEIFGNNETKLSD